MSFTNIILTIAATLRALQAGLYYAWSCSVMLGLARLGDREFVSAMQQMNRAILNRIFFISFFGAPIFLTAATIFHYHQPSRFRFLLAASVVFLAGTFAVTIFGNVPLNNRLNQFDLESASDDAIAAQRANFESRWNNLNTIRTVTSTVAVIFTIIACLSS